MFFFEKENQKTFIPFLGVLVFCSTARAEPAIWAVRSPTATVYLFGTMHLLPKKVDWFGPRLAAAFGDSSLLIEEADVGPGNSGAAAGMMARAMAPDYDVWSKLGPDAAAKFRKQIAPCHLPDSAVAHFKPWFAAGLPTLCVVMAQVGTGGSLASLSPETALAARAHTAKKTLAYFETAEEQIALMSSQPEALQIEGLKSAIAEGDDTAGDLAKMQSAWLNGDVAQIAMLIAGARTESADFYDLAITQRNRRFAAKIATLLHGTATVFVAIGAGHLAGPDSVQVQLARLSYSARRL